MNRNYYKNYEKLKIFQKSNNLYLIVIYLEYGLDFY